jgi:hypothetical protein
MDQKSNFRKKINEFLQENATGILGTVSFHLVLATIFLTIRISAERTLLESMIMLEFEEDTEEEILQEEAPDPEFDLLMARYLEESRSNIPVNIARQLDEQLSTDKYVDEIENELDMGRSEEYRELEERLRELEELSQEELIMEGDEMPENQIDEPFQGPTNIHYDLEFRYHLRLPVPVYQCIGEGIVEVKIAVDQRGRVIQAEIDKPGDSFNQICLAEAARKAALQTRFNADFDAPVRQQGLITYHFIAQ